MRRALLLVLSLLPALCHAELKIGVLAFRGESAAMARWSATADYLGNAIPEETFTIVPLDLEEMAHAVAMESLDFVLTNTGNYVVLEARHGVSRLATLKTHHQHRTLTRFGAVIFTRSDNTSIRSIPDLAGHSFMAVSREAFGGFQMAWREMRDQGLDPFRDLSRLRFNGFPQDAIVEAVLAGEVDAGTVRAGTLDRMAAEGRVSMEDIRVIEPHPDSDFPYQHSTRLYPEWPFAKTRKTPEALAQKVAIALLSMPPDSPAARQAGVGWTIPLDYGSVHALFRELEIGPYAELGRPGLDRVWREYSVWIVSGGVLLLTLGIISLLTAHANRKISQSEARLRAEVEQRRHTEQLLAAHRDTLERSVSERTAALAAANESLRRSESTLRKLHEITAVHVAPLESQIEHLLTEGCHYFRLSCGSLLAIESPDEMQILQTVITGKQGLAGEMLGQIMPALWELRRDDAVIALPDLTLDDPGGRQGALLAAPIRWRNGESVYLVFSDPQPADGRPFSDVDIDILLLMSGWLGSALEKRDISRQADERQHQLAHVTRLGAMGEIAAGIAHELNQPLTAIVNYANGCARLLKRGPEATGELEEAVNRIGSDALRAAETIRRLREFLSQGETSKALITLPPCIEVALQMVDERLQKRGITISRDIRGTAVEVLADRIQVEQVIVNLLLNAMDAVEGNPPGKRQIAVGLSATSDMLALDVVDNGPGFDDGEIERIFHPFYTSKTGGMGMGLSISRTIAEAHGGKLQAVRTKENLTRMRLTLPAASRQQTTHPADERV